jgi:hypothetical protein
MTFMTQDISASSLQVQHSDKSVFLIQGKADGATPGKGTL